MRERLYELVHLGLYQDNLLECIRLSRHLFFEAPALFGSLIFIFDSLSNEYDNQAIQANRYELIMDSLQPRIVRLLQAELESHETLAEALNDVYEQFGVLMGF